MKKTNKRTRFLWRKAGATGLLAAGLALFSLGNSFGQVLVTTGFTGQTLPTGWDTVSVTNDGEWAFDNPGGRTISNSSSTNFDSDFAIFDSDDWCGNDEDAELITPSFNASAATGLIVLSFDNSFRNYSLGFSECHVEVWNGTTWTDVLTLTGSDDGYPNANHKTIDITSACGAATTAKVRFRWVGACDWWWAVDNIKIEAISCVAPSGLTAGSVTAASAHVSWNTPSTGTPGNGYLYYYSTSSAAPSAATTVSGSTTDTFVNLTTLNSSTQYYFWVRSVCSSSDTSDWTLAPLVFQTTQIPVTLPYAEDFSSASPGWSFVNGSQTNQWAIGSATGNTGNSMYVSDDGGTSNEYDNTSSSVVQAYRDIILTAGAYPFTFTFDWKCKGEGTSTRYDYFRVWAVPTTFTPTAGTQITASASGGVQLGGSFNDPSGTGNWHSEDFTIPNTYAGDTIRLVFEWRNDGGSGTQPPAAIDNINLSLLTCVSPNGLVTNGITTNSATVSWNSQTTPANGFQYYYNTTGAQPVAGVTATGSTTDTFVNLSNLASNTGYYVWVRSICGAADTSNWSAVEGFTTLCSPYATPYSEGFENGYTDATEVAGCISQEMISTQEWKAYHNATSYNRTPRTGNWDAALRYGCESWMYIPIDLTGGTSYRLKFYARQDGSGASNASIDAAFGAAPISDSMTGTIVTSNGLVNGNYQEFFGDFVPATTGTYYIGIHGDINSSPWYITIDDISIEVSPTCFAPQGLVSGNITSSAAMISWNVPSVIPANGYEYYYNTTGTTPAASTVALGNSTDTFVNLSNLTSNTTYYVWVRSVCSASDTSEWSANNSVFTTLCSVATTPWLYDVESAATTTSSAIGDCWSSDPSNTSSSYRWDIDGSGSTPSSSTGPSGAHSGNKYFYTEASYGSAGDTAFLISPEINVSNLTTPAIDFYYHMYGSTMGNLYIQVSANGGSTWNTVDSIIGQQQTSENDPWLEKLISLSGYTGDLHIRFAGVRGSDFYGDMSLDDISVIEMPTCFAPLGLAAGNITPTTATVSWNTPSVVPGNGYAYYSNTTGTPPTFGTPATGTATDTFANISTLTANTQYYIWVRSVCSSTDTSDWSDVLTFRTPLVPVTLPYSEDFTAGGNWAFINDNQTNQWAIGAATGNTGNSLYVSDDGGTSNTYTNNSTSVVQAYKDIILTAGTNPFDLSFDWKCKGEGTSPYMYDYFRVWAVPKNFVPTAGTQITATASNGIQIGDNFNDPNGSGNWHSENFVIPNTYAGDTIRLVFEWRNDGSSGSQPPAAIDNVNVSVKICPVPGNISIANISSAGADINWQSPSETPGSGYEYYISDINTPPTATTTVTGASTDTFKSVSGLSPNTQYYVWVRSACSSTFKSDWTASANFTTLCDVPANNLGADQVICSGNSVTISTGNTATGTTYLWNDGSTGSTFIASAAGTYYCTVTNTYGCSNTDTVNVTLGANPDVNLGNDTGICSGNFVTLSVGNQPAGSTYLWSDGSTGSNLSVNTAGDYAVAVTNTTGCTTSDTINVAINPLPTVNLGADTVLCIGSSMTLSGGTQGAGSSYLWSDASTGSSLTIGIAGTYSLTVTTASGCVAADTITVSAGVVPVVNLGADTTFCSGNTLTLSGGAQASGSTYEWSNGSGSSTLAVNATGDYTLTVTNIVGCSASDTIAVTVTPSPVIDLGSDTMICTGATITLDAGAQTPGTTFLWNTTDTTQSVMVSDSGMYSVIADNNGCSVTDSVLIGIIPLPHADSITANAIAGGSYQFTAYGVGNTITYDWNFGDGVHSSNHNATHNYDQDGTYTVTLIVSNDCGADTVSITLEVTTGVHQISLGKDELKLYPNPAREKVTLKNESSFKMSSVQVYNILGQEVFNGKTSNTETYELHVQGLAAGMYNLRVNFTDGSWTTRKFEVNP